MATKIRRSLGVTLASPVLRLAVGRSHNWRASAATVFAHQRQNTLHDLQINIRQILNITCTHLYSVAPDSVKFLQLSYTTCLFPIFPLRFNRTNLVTPRCKTSMGMNTCRRFYSPSHPFNTLIHLPILKSRHGNCYIVQQHYVNSTSKLTRHVF